MNHRAHWVCMVLAMMSSAGTSSQAVEVTRTEAQKSKGGDRVMLPHDMQRALRALGSEHAHERDAASAWLLAHADASHPALIAAVQRGEPLQVALGALHLLGKMGEEADVSLLEGILNRGDPRLTWQAAQALGQHRSPRAREALVAALTQPNPEVAGPAAVALGGRGDATLRAVLEQLLARPEETVRYRAVHALRLLGVQPSAASLRRHYTSEPSEVVRRLIDEALQ